MPLGHATPILRMFDEGMARAFYIDWLGFAVTFEHRFGKDMPLYMGIGRDGLEIHLTEHHGDTTPGTRVRIATTDVESFYDEIMARGYAYAHPGRPCEMPWGETALDLTDPFGNRLTFYQRQ